MIRSPGAGLTLPLGSAQTLAWASSYYLPAILAEPISLELELSTRWVFGAFSAALLLVAMLGPSVGRLIDRQGGRGVLMASNAIMAMGLLALAPLLFGLLIDQGGAAALWLTSLLMLAATLALLSIPAPRR